MSIRKALIVGVSFAMAFTARQSVHGQDLDLSVASIEVNQAVQFGNTVLVAERATIVRVSVDVGTAANPVSGVDAIMRVYDGGVEIPESPLFSENGPITAPLTVDLENEDDTINFAILPSESLDLVFEIQVNPPGPGQLAETNFSNNILATAPLTFECRRVPEIVYVPMDWRPNNEPDPNLPDPELIKPGVGDGFVQGIYPSGDFNYHRSPMPSFLWVGPPGSSTLSQLNALRVMMDPIPDHIYGWFPGSVPGNGLGQINGPAGYGNTQPIRHQRTFAHELGHNVGLFHNTRTINTVGVDVEHHLLVTEGLPRIKDPAKRDIMWPGLFTHQAWVDEINYNHFLSHPLFDCGMPDSGSPEPKVLYVTGAKDNQTGKVKLNPAVALSNLPITESTAQDDATVNVATFVSGAKIAEISIQAVGSSDSCPACQDSEEPAPDSPLSFMISAESAGGDPIDHVVISNPSTGKKLAELIRSANSPRGELLKPTQGETLDGEVAVKWSGSDADGDSLTYFLQYSPDGGNTFVPLTVYSKENTCSFDTSDVPASVGDKGLLRLTVSDGLNNWRDEVSGLSIGGGNPPWVFNVSPNDGSTHLKAATIFLHASAWDLEDKFMDGTSLEWTSDVDGFLGNGRLLTVADLSVGTHVITITGTDTDLMQDSDSVTITILDRVLPLDPCSASQLFVDASATGGNNGLSWADAFNDLQDALDQVAACSGTVNEIWIAKGTYKPDRGTGDRSETFQLSNGITVYGGFPTGGGDGTFDARDPATIETILSGDLNGDDGWSFTNSGENSYHVVTISGDATLDGVTVSGGNANDSGTGNTSGGGLLINGSPTLATCVIKNNQADALGGGAFFAQFELQSATLTDCRFENNRADIGGGLWVHGWLTNMIVTRCIFLGNDATTSGGGMYLQFSDLTMTNCGFFNNQSDIAGGLQLNSSNSAMLTNGIFRWNFAWNNGGGVYAVSSGLTMTNCTVSSNLAGVEGGGVWGNSTFEPATIANSIFWENATDGLQVMDEAAQITYSSPSLTITDNIIQGWTGGGSNSGLDPLFVRGGQHYNQFEFGLNLRLRDGSPAIDSGNNASLPPDVADLDGDGDVAEPIPLDFEDRTRVFNGTVDLGAFEFDGSRRSYVDHTATGANDGTSWANAYNELRDAIDAAQLPGAEIDSIWVATGSYLPTAGSDRTETFALSNGLGIFGGFPNGGGDGTFGARDPNAFITTLSGDLSGNDLPNFINYDENSYHVVSVSGFAYIDGFTIHGGNANSTEVDPVYGYPIDIDGGGLYINNGYPVITGCIIKDNRADGRGGAVLFDQPELASGKLTECVIRGNEADMGGGLWCYGWLTNFVMTRCMFVDNLAFNGGGGVHNLTDMTITNCAFLGNGTLASGGGIRAEFVARNTITNSIFSGNFAVVDGGGVAADNDMLTVTNSSFSRNLATGSGAGLWVNADGSIDNSIFWENSVNGVMDQDAQITFFSPSLTINDNIIQGWTGGGTNLNVNPVFVDADGLDNVDGTVDDNLRLGASSPAINIGNNAALPSDVADLDADGNVSEVLPRDLDEVSRVIGGIVDLGAYERLKRRVGLLDTPLEIMMEHP